ncbi:uncharacterized protein LOC132700030 [Cylas formicarius]|uniref:uncharacterized protein LOC132700030 n=1 Tax=Cylas formicarius TaxID=197179 RepID=UPI0029588E47|nr:uncharacterized protein LOC132700030 [Cylas formicarius]
MSLGSCHAADICSGYSLIDCVKKAMKGRIIGCSPHTDIYFLETADSTAAKDEENHLETLFVSPAGREMMKYKPTSKLKQKTNPNLEFFTKMPRKSRKRQPDGDKRNPLAVLKRDEPATECVASSSDVQSMDLYEEAAAILGLACAQTDDCKCLECQCHYFDFEEEIDFPTAGNDYGLFNMDNESTCSIQ